MSTSITVHAHDTNLTTSIRKVWEHELHADPSTSYSLRLTTTDGDEVTLFVSLNQLDALAEAVNTYVAKAIDVPAPTINDIKRMIEENEGVSLA